MPRPRDVLQNGVRAVGVVADEVVTVIEVTAVGEGSFVRYAGDRSGPGSVMLSAEQLAGIVVEGERRPDLAADAETFRLAVEALRIRCAHASIPLLAVSSSNVEPLPHQVQAVYQHLLRAHPQRFLLADDPGAGKTIMAGLFIKEAMARGWVSRCLIVVPGSLAEQWADELNDKFGLRFDVFDPSSLRRGTSDDRALEDHPLLIVRLDQAARSERYQAMLRSGTYDLAIVDEAHKMTARYWGNRVEKSKRFQLGELLRDSCPSLLLMTATPHNGKEEEFQLFLSLLRDAGREEHVEDATGAGLMRRLVKEQLVHLDGSRLFPERRASTVGYRLSPLEHGLYEAVSEYVREEMNKVSGDESKRTVGFALLVLQRRLASSPEAIVRSLARRHDRLQSEASRLRAADARLAGALAASLGLAVPDFDEIGPGEAEAFEDDASSVATASRSLAELEFEIAIVARLVTDAERVREARVDAKWEALAQLLTNAEMFEADGTRRKIIIFTEHRDTLEYLEQRLFELLPSGTGIEVIHGAVGRGERKLAQVRFTRDRGSSVLLATDAAGEGVNLQVAHLMINYDIPWNPNRLEQRFGRIHRIGQRHVCHLWNLVAVDTREGDVFARLLQKLESQREALGDQVFDVLGQVLTDANLGQLLTRALSGNGTTLVDSRIEEVSADLADAVHRRATSVSTLTSEELVALRREMALARAASFQPEVVRDFAVAALTRLRGTITTRGDVWSVDHVPAQVRAMTHLGVRGRYDSVVFQADLSPAPSMRAPELLGPGHPLISGLVDAVLSAHAPSLSRGVVLEDDRCADDYVLASVVRDDDGAQYLGSYRIETDGRITPVDAGLYGDLRSSPPRDRDSSAAAAEIDAVGAAIALVDADGLIDGQVTAVAFVRGSASPEYAASWVAARAALGGGLHAIPDRLVTAALDGQGWDFAVSHGATQFLRAVPAGTRVPPRRSEKRAEDHAAGEYEVREVAVPGV